MSIATDTGGSGRWLICLMIALVCVFSLTGAASAAPVASFPGIAADVGSPLFASFLQDVIGNRTRMIQASFIFILVGIFILWKK